VLADARVALAFLTRIPVDDGRMLDARAMNRAAIWFPAVGLLVGAVVGGVRLLAELALPAGPATVLALTAGILLTGGFHEDGLADIADGVGAHVGRARKLEILRDSRVGTFGALAVALPLLFAYACLVPLSGEDVLAAAVCAHVLGRWSVLPHSRLAGPARTDGSGTLVRASIPGLALGSLFTAGVLVAAAGIADGAVMAGVAIVVTGAAGLGLARVLGGVTGDSYGAVNKLVELGAYATAAALWAT
jgi:adenosylcobinamide-GDP ribazoletransferase